MTHFALAKCHTCTQTQRHKVDIRRESGQYGSSDMQFSLVVAHLVNQQNIGVAQEIQHRNYVLKTYFPVRRAQKVCFKNILFGQKSSKSMFWKHTFRSKRHKKYVLKTYVSVKKAQKECFENLLFGQKAQKVCFENMLFGQTSSKSMFWKHTFRSKRHKNMNN